MMIEEKIAQFPTTPGVYLMKGEGGRIIYVGKAKNLRARVKNYFTKEADSRYQVKFLLKRIKDIDYLITDNEKEALLLENSLIKKHKPRYNVFLKDDKSYVSLRLSLNHQFPSLTITRNIRKDGALYFGPYSSADACRETVEFIYRHFLLRTCSDHEITNRSRPCLEYQIHRCTAPCVGYVTKEEYAKQVEQVRLLLEGKNKELISELKTEMKEAAENEKFEKAAAMRDLLGKIDVTLEKQKVVKHGGIHQDLVSLYRQEDRGVIALLNIRDGNLIDSRYFPIKSMEESSDLIENFLGQLYITSPFIPDEILISTSLEDTSALITVLSEKKGKKVVIRSPKKGEKKDLIELAEKNALAQFTQMVKKEYHTLEALKLLQERLGISKFLHRMECYDISNISGQMSTGSRVVFIDGEADKNEYRKYKIRIDGEPNDYAMMSEVLGRRLASLGKKLNKDDVGRRTWDVGREKKDVTSNVLASETSGRSTSYDLPDLLVIDGGKGQLNAALKILEETGFSQIPVIGVAKGKGQGARAKGLWSGKKEEEIYLPHRKNPLHLKRGSSELMLLQRLRDEAHRFAIQYHRKLREKKMEVSPLDHVKGLGPEKKKRLLQRFKTIQAIKEASVTELTRVKGITKGLGEQIKRAI